MESLFKKIIQEAIWAPTPDNVQGWKFNIDGNTLTVEVDQSRVVHPIDPHHHAQIISLGGLNAYISIVAAKYGFDIDWSLSEEDCLKLSVSLKKTDVINQNAATIYPYLKKRRTDRRPYKDDVLDHTVINEILKTNPFYNSNVHFKETPSKRFFQYLQKSDYFFWKEPEAIQATLRWVEFSNTIPQTGFSYQNLGLKRLEAIAIGYLNRHQTLFRWALKSGLAKLSSHKTSQIYTHSGGFLLFTVDQISRQSLFELGRHAVHCWLTLTKHGIAAQPLSFASISCFDIEKTDQDFPYVTKNHSHFEGGIKTLRTEFNTSSDQHACWLLRIGKNDCMPNAMIPARLDYNDLKRLNR